MSMVWTILDEQHPSTKYEAATSEAGCVSAPALENESTLVMSNVRNCSI